MYSKVPVVVNSSLSKMYFAQLRSGHREKLDIKMLKAECPTCTFDLEFTRETVQLSNGAVSCPICRESLQAKIEKNALSLSKA